MRDPGAEEAVLSREELDALLESLAGEPGSAREWTAPARGRAAMLALGNAVESFAEEQSRQLSNVHESAIRFSVVGWREVERGEIAAAFLATDQLAIFCLEPSLASGFFVIGRPLLFNLMCLNFGAQAGLKRYPAPTRPYTRIEMRVYRRLATDMLQQLDEALGAILPVRTRLLSMQGPQYLLDDPRERMGVATLDVRGFGEVCRLRVGLPLGPFAGIGDVEPVIQPGGASPLESTVLEMPLDLRVELASLDLPLARLSELGVGDTLPIDAADDGQLLVQIEGTPKFRAIRGTVGQRVAVQLTERL